MSELFTKKDYEDLLIKVEKYEYILNKMSCDIPGMIESKTFDYEKGYYRLLDMVKIALDS